MVKKSTSRAGSKQWTLFGAEKDNREPASELMKVVAEKVPSKKKFLKDFAPEEARMILSKLRQNKNENEKMETGVDMGKYKTSINPYFCNMNNRFNDLPRLEELLQSKKPAFRPVSRWRAPTLGAHCFVLIRCFCFNVVSTLH